MAEKTTNTNKKDETAGVPPVQPVPPAEPVVPTSTETGTQPTPPAQPSTTPKKAGDDSIVMTKTEYETLMASIAEMQKKVEYVSDKARLERWDAKQNTGKSLLPVAGITTIDGKYILGWKTVSNEAEFRNNLYIERQVIEVAFDDQTFQKMDYVDFVRHKVKVSGEVIEKKTVGGEEYWTIRLPDGAEKILGVQFIN